MKSLCDIYTGVVCRALLAAALCFVVGCEKEKSRGEIALSDDAISFEEYSFSDSVTKGASTDAFSTGDSFCVYAYSVTSGGAISSSTPPDIMNGVEVTLSGLSWGYSPIAYWPAIGHDTHFVAYSPCEDTKAGISVDLAASTGGYPTITYDMPETCIDQPDLMVASRVYLSSVLGGGLMVDLKFDHKLSRISFQVQGNKYRRLTGVTIKNIYGTADLTYDGTTEKWAWDNYSDVGSFAAGVTATNPNTDPDVATSVTLNDGYILAIPQTLPDDAEVEITYCEYDTTTPITKTLSLPDNSEWGIGKQYTYGITLMDNITIELSSWASSFNPQDETHDSYEVEDYDSESESSDSITDVDDVLGVGGYEDDKTTSDTIPSSSDDGYDVDDAYDGEHSYTDTI